jgi:hypothetical protein
MLILPNLSQAKVFNVDNLQETNFELSSLEFKGENLTSKSNPAKAFLQFADSKIPLKITNKDQQQRLVIQLPRFPLQTSDMFVEAKLLIFGGDVSETSPQKFDILLVRQP